jgi:hypothetical protein
MPFQPEKHRAAYWRADNRPAGGILLSGKEHAACPSGMLAQVARDTAARLGLTLGGGWIVVIGADGRQEWHAKP